MEDMTPAERAELNDAVNLVCNFVCENLPDGYEITLSMSLGEATFSMNDPEGDELEDCGNVVEMVKEAIEQAEENS